MTARLPNIVSVSILSDQQVRLRAAPDRGLHLIGGDGGLIDHLHFIDAATGAVRPDPNARPNEVTLTAGQICQDSLDHSWNAYRFVELRSGRVIFHHTGFRRDGSAIDARVEIAPY